MRFPPIRGASSICAALLIQAVPNFDILSNLSLAVHGGKSWLATERTAQISSFRHGLSGARVISRLARRPGY
jgi:hypothetical protein